MKELEPFNDPELQALLEAERQADADVPPMAARRVYGRVMATVGLALPIPIGTEALIGKASTAMTAGGASAGAAGGTAAAIATTSGVAGGAAKLASAALSAKVLSLLGGAVLAGAVTVATIAQPETPPQRPLAEQAAITAPRDPRDIHSHDTTRVVPAKPEARTMPKPATPPVVAAPLKRPVVAGPAGPEIATSSPPPVKTKAEPEKPAVAEPSKPKPPEPEKLGRNTTHDSALSFERALLEQARQAISLGQARDALGMLTQHERRFPAGRMIEEREALAVRALAAAGQIERARQRAMAFERRFPRSFLLPVVAAAVADDKP